MALAWLREVRNWGLLVAPSNGDYEAATERVLDFADQPITLFDTTLAVMSARLGLPVWTYDHHFVVMGVPVWR